MNKPVRQLIQYCLPLVVLGCHAIPSRSATESYEWIIDQSHVRAGSQRIYVAPSAIRICNLGRGFEVLAKAPEWKVEIRRNDNKTVLYMPLTDFPKFSVFGALGNHGVPKEKLDKVGSETKNGILLSKYLVKTTRRPELLVADDIPVTNQEKTILSAYYNMPLAPGIVISSRLTQTSQSKDPFFQMREDSMQNELLTRHWSKKKFDGQDFQNCHGFRQVRSLSDILVSEAKKREVDEDFKDLGFGRATRQ